MSESKKINVLVSNERTYLFEMLNKKKKGIFIADFLDGSEGEQVLVIIKDDIDDGLIAFTGKIDWVNRTEDFGVGIIFDEDALDKFETSIKLIKRIAYI